jgi:UPF0176 protein
MSTKVVAALYKFVKLENYRELRDSMQARCDALCITGTLLLADEGINGTIAGTRENIDAILRYLRSDPRLADLPHKESAAVGEPFYRMKVKLKKEIVTMGVAGIDPTALVGDYVKPEDWNALINDPEVLLVDTRNDYEVDVGTFKGAVNPHITTFREFPEYVKQNFDPERQPKVAMFCTGGIRCEKASAFMQGLSFARWHIEVSGDCSRRAKSVGGRMFRIRSACGGRPGAGKRALRTLLWMFTPDFRTRQVVPDVRSRYILFALL